MAERKTTTVKVPNWKNRTEEEVYLKESLLMALSVTCCFVRQQVTEQVLSTPTRLFCFQGYAEIRVN
jgi:hypothetical protein